MFADLNTDRNGQGAHPYDIALIKTNHSIDLTMNNVKPIPLINITDDVPVGSDCVVPGWGETKQDGGLYIHKYIYIYIYIVVRMWV